ncbi:hypothetical protein AAGV33_04390 [Flavobacterium sp. FBOR7N2.3]|uniref:DUF2007 domain-containing protein n=1 Tax=Flavobacterium magnesitis TaxID=3138077 RepID=A0ABV4TI09_9FLAO
MIENFNVFRSFSTLTQAQELEVLLNENNIDTVLGDNIAPVDVMFSGSTLHNQYEVKISPFNFEKAESILEKEAVNALEDIDEDYYLFSFTDEELYEILMKSDEWNAFDYKLSQKILINRGRKVDDEMLIFLKNERLKILAKPEENQKSWIIAGYLFSILGGGIGIFIGYSLWTSKKTLPNGERIYSYKEEDRKNGKNIFIIGLIIFSALLIIKILNML